jgi:hypothetical protein
VCSRRGRRVLIERCRSAVFFTFFFFFFLAPNGSWGLVAISDTFFGFVAATTSRVSLVAIVVPSFYGEQVEAAHPTIWQYPEILQSML